MKYSFRPIAVLCVIALLSLTAACSQSAAPTPAPTSPPAAETSAEMAAPEDDAPIDEAPVEETKLSDNETEASAEENAGDQSQVIEDNSAYKNELTDYEWVLSSVLVNGDLESPASYYGSVIRETGAYLEFHKDDTFTCILGFRGCKGTYEVRSGEISAHITTIYDGKSDSGIAVEKDVVMSWLTTQDYIAFNYEDDVTNIFTIR